MAPVIWIKTRLVGSLYKELQDLWMPALPLHGRAPKPFPFQQNQTGILTGNIETELWPQEYSREVRQRYNREVKLNSTY